MPRVQEVMGGCNCPLRINRITLPSPYLRSLSGELLPHTKKTTEAGVTLTMWFHALGKGWLSQNIHCYGDPKQSTNTLLCIAFIFRVYWMCSRKLGKWIKAWENVHSWLTTMRRLLPQLLVENHCRRYNLFHLRPMIWTTRDTLPGSQRYWKPSFGSV